MVVDVTVHHAAATYATKRMGQENSPRSISSGVSINATRMTINDTRMDA